MKLLKCINSLFLCVFLAAFVFCGTVYAGEPLKVFILAGQSNMVGHGEMIGTTPGHLETLVANDPANYGHLKDVNGNWVVRSDVWIHYNRLSVTGADGVIKKGGLSAGYGGADTTIGPELQFGNVLGDFYEAPVFILKFASGGKSLFVDYRPPSSGWDKTPTANGDRGYYYKKLIDTINAFKANPGSFCDGYNPADGYEFAGFGWHQGWNDLGDFSAQYEVNMRNFIKDFRSDIGVSDLPFSISTTGMANGDEYSTVELAQLAMADFMTYPLFEGNVAVDDTTGYQRAVSESPSNQGFHWNRNAESYCLIGTGMGEGMVDLLVDPNAPYIDAGDDKITWSGEPIYMDPNVVEMEGTDWTNLTYKWTAVPDTDVTISDDQVADPTVTITKAAGDPLTVVFKLEVNDSSRIGHGVINAMQVDVYDDKCKAAIGKGFSVDNPTDLDGDCVTDLADFAKLASQWFYSGVLLEPQKK